MYVYVTLLIAKLVYIKVDVNKTYKGTHFYI